MRKQFSTEEKQLILKKSLSKCSHCGKKLTMNNMTVEHMYPIDKGGSNDANNLVALCEVCNKSKSNFIYDISYYPFLVGNERHIHEKVLLNNIYSEISDSHILGKLNRIAYVMDSRYAQWMENKKLKNVNAFKFLARPIEFRELFPGDISDNILKLIGSQYYDIREPEKELVANKYAIANIVKNGTVYGAYSKDELLAVFGYININQIELKDKEFLEELNKLGYDNTYVEILRSYKEKDRFIAENVNEKIAEFMAFTNNLVILAPISNDGRLVIKNNLMGKKSTIFKMPANYDYIGESACTLTLNDDNFNNLKDGTDFIKKHFEKIDIKIS